MTHLSACFALVALAPFAWCMPEVERHYGELRATVAKSMEGSVDDGWTPPPQFRLAQVYADHMVLQCAPYPASVWGYAAPHAEVEVSVDQTSTVSTNANAEGVWLVLLPTQACSSTPHTIAAQSDDKTLALKDVLFGDVWVCSGQSNMAFSVSVPLVDKSAESKIAHAYATDPGASPNGTYIDTESAIKLAANYPTVRLFVVGDHHECPQPIPDFYPSINDSRQSIAMQWTAASPSSVNGGPDVMGGGHFSATCWYFGMELHDRLKRPIGLMHASYGGSAVEDWISNQTLGNGQTGPCPGPITKSMGLPTQQYNGEIHPLLNVTIKGAIWYQGESNHGQDLLYTCRYSQMMEEWRREWHYGTEGATDINFPIGFVQIGPMSTKVGPAGSDGTYAIRMGQTADYGYAPNARWPHSFMATAFDLANPPKTKCFAGCVHIFNKQAVGHRLAVSARHVVYGEKDLVYSGPRVTKLTQGKEAITVTYGVGAEGGGIVLRSGYGFEVCSSDCGAPTATWTPVNITSSTATTVTIPAPAGTKSVRYAFDDMPSLFYGTQPAVYNAEGLPATPGTYNISSLVE